MEALRLHTVINKKYQVFDRSGLLPFSIVFGLCRRYPEDTDPRPLVLNTAESILDVPYALTHELLAISGHDVKTKSGFPVDVGKLSQIESQNSFITVPSPVGRTKHWRHSLVVYEYHVDPASELGSLLEPGNNYEIRIKKGVNFGGKGHSYTNETIGATINTISASTEQSKIVCSRADGRAMFKVVESLPCPPEIQTRMQRSEGNDAAIIEVTVLHKGTDTVTVQTRGRQRYLTPWAPMQPHEEYPSRPRIIDLQKPAPAGHLQVVDMATNNIVHQVTKPPLCELCQQHDPRPQSESLLTLNPGEQLVRQVDVSKLFSKLPDGKYGLRMEPRGMWWCPGSCNDWPSEGDGRVPQHLWKTLIPPLVLQCGDVVELRVENGLAV